MIPKADELGHLIGGLYSTGPGAQKGPDLQRRFCRSERGSGKMVRMRMEMKEYRQQTERDKEQKGVIHLCCRWIVPGYATTSPG